MENNRSENKNFKNRNLNTNSKNEKTPKPVGSGTDPMGSANINPLETTKDILAKQDSKTGTAGTGSGAGDVNALEGLGRTGILGSGTDDVTTTAVNKENTDKSRSED